MAKRFTDTNKYKKPFMRRLPGPYKLLWDYLYLDCDHAGIWIVDFEIAQVYLGNDMPVCQEEALRLFNEGEKRIVVLNGGSRWFIAPFIEFQYGELNENNRAHNSVIMILKKWNLRKDNKVLLSPFQGAMDMDMVKDKDKVKEKKRVQGEKKEEPKVDPFLALADLPDDPNHQLVKKWAQWVQFRTKIKKPYKTTEGAAAAYNRLLNLAGHNSTVAMEIIDQSIANEWQGFFPLKEEQRNGNSVNGKAMTDSKRRVINRLLNEEK